MTPSCGRNDLEKLNRSIWDHGKYPRPMQAIFEEDTKPIVSAAEFGMKDAFDCDNPYSNLEPNDMRQELESTIAELRSQIAESKEITPDEIAELKDRLEEISDSLDRDEIDSASLMNRLQEHVESFRDSHPTLTQTVGRLADALSQMGI